MGGIAEGNDDRLPPMSLNVKCNLCFTWVVIEAGIDHHYFGIDVVSMLDACRSLLVSLMYWVFFFNVCKMLCLDLKTSF